MTNGETFSEVKRKLDPIFFRGHFLSFSSPLMAHWSGRNGWDNIHSDRVMNCRSSNHTDVRVPLSLSSMNMLNGHKRTKPREHHSTGVAQRVASHCLHDHGREERRRYGRASEWRRVANNSFLIALILSPSGGGYKSCVGGSGLHKNGLQIIKTSGHFSNFLFFCVFNWIFIFYFFEVVRGLKL